MNNLIAFSRLYGANPELVLAGGGNTSMKENGVLHVKGSGCALATIEEKNFVALDIAMLKTILHTQYPDADSERERAFLADVMAARLPGEEGRPSVEALLHALFPQRYVLHLHPALVNGLTCAVSGEKEAARLFPDALWFPSCRPGYTLAKLLSDKINANTQTVLLQNHGVFFAADTPEELRVLLNSMLDTLRGCVGEVTELPDVDLAKPFTPDHIVYCGVGKELPDNENARLLYKDAQKIAAYSEHFGGPLPLDAELVRFILNWEAESYRKLKANDEVMYMTFEEAKQKAAENAGFRPQTSGRLAGRLAVVTGGAQGFGLGLAQELYREGASVVIADMNEAQGSKAAGMLGERAHFVPVDVSDEESVKRLMAATVETLGGIDLFISNAGVLKAGALPDMSAEDFDFVTRVNYKGYFLCAKYASEIMRAQFEADHTLWSDIIQINSKSGLTGSKANFAYAGGKFGGIGLTQSFALELIPYQVKVNAVCPGNYYDGPLWSDPERGLFVQYLNAGKVPGAATVEDVKEFYLSKSPIKRGCLPEDVAKAVFYCVEQCYETGQAIPVTGGQVMLS